MTLKVLIHKDNKIRHKEKYLKCLRIKFLVIVSIEKKNIPNLNFNIVVFLVIFSIKCRLLKSRAPIQKF